MKKATLVRLEPPTLAYLQRLSDTYSKSQANLVRACIEAGLPIVEHALITQSRQFIKQTAITQKQLLGDDPNPIISSSEYLVHDLVSGQSEHRLLTHQLSAPRPGRPRSKKAEPPRRKSTRPIDLDNFDEKSK